MHLVGVTEAMSNRATYSHSKIQYRLTSFAVDL